MFTFVNEQFAHGISQFVFHAKGNAIHIVAELRQLGLLAKNNITVSKVGHIIYVHVLNSQRYKFVPGEDYHLHLIQTGLKGVDEAGILDINMMFHWEKDQLTKNLPYVASWFRHEEPIIYDSDAEQDKPAEVTEYVPFVTDETWERIFDSKHKPDPRIDSADYYGDTSFDKMLDETFYFDEDGSIKRVEDLLNAQDEHIRRFGSLRNFYKKDNEEDENEETSWHEEEDYAEE